MRRIGAVAALCVALVVGLTVGNAASLSVTAGSMTSRTATACAASVTLTRTDPVVFGLFGFNSVTVTVPPACVGLRFDVTVARTSNGTAIATGSSAALGSGNVRVPVSATYGGILGDTYTFAVIINGWSVDANA